jgi:hypothetical protein
VTELDAAGELERAARARSVRNPAVVVALAGDLDRFIDGDEVDLDGVIATVDRLVATMPQLVAPSRSTAPLPGTFAPPPQLGPTGPTPEDDQTYWRRYWARRATGWAPPALEDFKACPRSEPQQHRQ